MQSLSLLGNEKVYRALICNLVKPQTIRCKEEDLHCRLLTVSGKAKVKSLRLYKSAIEILESIGAKEYYLQTFWKHKFPGDSVHKDRNFRVAETIAMFMRAGFEYRPYLLPKLCGNDIRITVKGNPVFYPSKDLKKVGEIEMNKTMFSRVTGVVFANGAAYAVYNTRNAIMKWNGMSEFKVMHDITSIARMNAGIQVVDSALLFGQTDKIALATILETEKNRRLEFRFDLVYTHIHFIPLDNNGLRQLKLLFVPNWRERLLEVLFDDSDRSYNSGQFEYDALVDGVYVYSFLDGDIARLIRLKNAIKDKQLNLEVICFPYQTELLKTYLGTHVVIKNIEPNVIESALGIKEETVEE